jgi:hypothetical protein
VPRLSFCVPVGLGLQPAEPHQPDHRANPTAYFPNPGRQPLQGIFLAPMAYLACQVCT